jgi:hypothetical protein
MSALIHIAQSGPAVMSTSRRSGRPFLTDERLIVFSVPAAASRPRRRVRNARRRSADPRLLRPDDPLPP